MKKSLFILAVLGITFTTCEKDDSQPNNSPTNNGGNNPTGGTGGTGEVDSRDTITLRSYNVNYESIEKIVLIKAEYDDGALEDEYKLTISIDRKSTRLNSSHVRISYAVFCLKKKKKKINNIKNYKRISIILTSNLLSRKTGIVH